MATATATAPLVILMLDDFFDPRPPLKLRSKMMSRVLINASLLSTVQNLRIDWLYMRRNVKGSKMMMKVSLKESNF